MKTLMHATALGMALTTAAAAPTAMAQTAPTAAAADTMFKATTFNLSATGETRVAPNMASISLGVMTEGKNAAEALAANATIFLPIESRWYRVDEHHEGNRQFVVQDPDGYLLRFWSDLGSYDA